MCPHMCPFVLARKRGKIEVQEWVFEPWSVPFQIKTFVGSLNVMLKIFCPNFRALESMWLCTIFKIFSSLYDNNSNNSHYGVLFYIKCYANDVTHIFSLLTISFKVGTIIISIIELIFSEFQRNYLFKLINSWVVRDHIYPLLTFEL